LRRGALAAHGQQMTYAGRSGMCHERVVVLTQVELGREPEKFLKSRW
jgi:hypothetical protein